MTLSVSNVRGNASITTYPILKKIKSGDIDQLLDVAHYDHVGCILKDSYRNDAHFESADVIFMDCDNDDSENPSDWLTPESLHETLCDVEFYAVGSRHNEIWKKDKSPRPRYHYYFPFKDQITDIDKIRHLKQEIARHFPMDKNALDASRCFFGVENPKGVYYPGERTIEDYLEEFHDDYSDDSGLTLTLDEVGAVWNGEPITQGYRHGTLVREAARILKRYGDCEQARNEYEKRLEACSPPYDLKDAERIWRDAVDFYNRTIKASSDYVSPEAYGKSLEPTDYSDLGQASVFTESYGEETKYNPSTDWLVYNGVKWEQSSLKAQDRVHRLTDAQIDEARKRIHEEQDALLKATEAGDTDEMKSATMRLASAKKYHAFVCGRRNSSRIKATLTEAQPKLEISTDALDADPFLLNMPTGCIDLRTGKVREHNSTDYFTKVTACDLSGENADTWTEFLKQITSGDTDTAHYLQQVAGMALIGHVYQEKLIVCYGQGGGGKSTFWNTLLKVLGDYGMTLSADILTTDTQRNKRPELAELRGRRLVVCGELEDGKRLDTGIMKRLVSTDVISAEQKYRDPITFVPSHSLVLFSNHLPRVGANDSGTWDRLAVIPFNARFRNTKNEVKNFSDVLFHEAGGALLRWMCEGAYEFIKSGYVLTESEAVKEITAEYRQDNDWLKRFVDSCCDVGRELSSPARALFERYIAYAEQCGEWHRSEREFKQAMIEAGYSQKRSMSGMSYLGVELLPVQSLSVTL